MNLSSLPSRVQALRDGFARCAMNVRSLAGTSRYTRFVIVGIARTGSTMLINLLNAHARALAFGELFRKPEAIGWDVHPYTDYRSERLLTLYQSDPCRFSRRRSSGNGRAANRRSGSRFSTTTRARRRIRQSGTT